MRETRLQEELLLSVCRHRALTLTMVALSAQVAAEVATSGATRHSLGWPEGQRAREHSGQIWPESSSHRVLPLYNPTPAFVQTKGNPWSEYKCCDRTSNSVTAKTEKPSRGACDTASSHEREIWYLLQGVFQKKNWPHISLFPKSKFFFFRDILQGSHANKFSVRVGMWSPLL